MNRYEIFNALEKEHNDEFLNLTYDIIETHKKNIVKELPVSKNIRDTFLAKLKGYRYIDSFQEIKFGSYARWIKLQPEITLCNGGWITDIKIGDKGSYLVCKNNIGRFMRINIDECIIFQKLTNQEHIILKIMESLND